MKINVLKCHGSNNDFYLIDEMENALPLSDEQRSDLALHMCKRQNNEGADGILFVMASSKADAKMRIFNSDGSEASMCGNGLRCVGRYVQEKLNKGTLIIETMKANLQVNKEPDMYKNIPTYRVEISPVLTKTKDLPMNTDYEEIKNQILPFIDPNLHFTTLAVPNPHLVSIVDRDTMQSDRQQVIASQLNSENEWFPDGVNVSFIYRLAPRKLFVRTYERGVGFTNACGTAMSASSLATKWVDGLQNEVTLDVYNPGGMVKCQIHETTEKTWIDLIGNATYEYSAILKIEAGNSIEIEWWTRETFEAEEAAYKEFQNHVKEYLAEKITL